ncbi:hypothetical protein LHU53_13175 [Rhodoferax sp. U2-2l]|uniref:hypothetical protein n=1 Tax=Rhodoferax sp. U2-2l TaxID=2884000 RepID=UPI001D0AC532|nr:hypothetical protein [Rhodoferax sp. U2-2l]MCB8747857.1 hypothetical protein [Rhodoferax sp. U2-2l]
MNKIVIVGHPLSGYQEVQNLLNACGMAVAQPSRREGFMPEQISTTLCKVHDTPLLSQLDREDHIQQIEPGPVWHGMALDLMLGNLEQPIWGWADPQAIYLLNYWRDLDPSITFILVYDRPHSMLTQADADEALALNAETLSARARNWAAYNAAMLHFFHRNPQRCLLVHSQQVREAAGSYLQQVRARIDAPWSERMHELAAPVTLQDSENTPCEPLCDPAPFQDALATSQVPDSHNPATPQRHALALFLAEALLQQHPTSLQLYQDLQAVANLPLADGSDVVINKRSAMDAWLAMAANDQRLSHTEAMAQQKQQLVERLSQAQAQAEQLAQDRQRIIDEQTRLHHSQSEASQRRLAELQREQQILQDAHQASMAAAQKLADQRAAELTQQAEQLKQQLTEKDQLAQNHAAQASQSQAEKLASQQENELLLTQLHQVQEELERHYLDAQQQKAALKTLQETERLAGEKSNQLSQQAEQLKQALTEKERQAQAQAAQLQCIIDEQTRLHHSQSEASQRRLAELQREQQALQDAHQASMAAAQKLADQRAAELTQQAEQLKQQLTEKEQLAQNHAAQANQSQAEKLASQQENELLLTQLHQVQEELERHYLEVQQQKAALKTLQEAEKLAAERAKNITQLSQEKAKLIGEKDNQAKLAAERAAHNEQLKKQLAAQTQLASEKTTQLSQQAEQLKKQLAEKEQLAKKQQQQAEHLKQQLTEKEQQARAQAAQLQAQLTAAQTQAAAAAPVVDPALEQENELLLSQLHQVQEELERYYLQSQAQSQQLTKLAQAEEGTTTHQQELEKLQAELQALKAAPPVPALAPINEQLLTQLFQAQEEQERRFHGITSAPPALVDLTPADRVRQQLSYRLGSTMIERSRTLTGWLSMPVALVKTTRQYRRDLAARAGHPRPAPANVHDKQMADSVKQHLSYKLGTTLIDHSRSPIGWVKMPFALRREVKDFKQRKHG